jgi:hypothetical protein
LIKKAKKKIKNIIFIRKLIVKMYLNLINNYYKNKLKFKNQKYIYNINNTKRNYRLIQIFNKKTMIYNLIVKMICKN